MSSKTRILRELRMAAFMPGPQGTTPRDVASKTDGHLRPRVPFERRIFHSTANGQISVKTLDAIQAEFGRLPSDLANSEAHSIVAMDLSYGNSKTFEAWIKKSGLNFRTTESGHYATHPEDTANVILSFRQPLD